MRVTTSSMPPPTEFSGTFYGDYTGLAASATAAFPLWMDTRNLDLFLCPSTGVPGAPPQICKGTATNAQFANDQDAFTQQITIP